MLSVCLSAQIPIFHVTLRSADCLFLCEHHLNELISLCVCVCVYIVAMEFNLLLVFSKYCEDVSTQIGAVRKEFL